MRSMTSPPPIPSRPWLSLALITAPSLAIAIIIAGPFRASAIASEPLPLPEELGARPRVATPPSQPALGPEHGVHVDVDPSTVPGLLELMGYFAGSNPGASGANLELIAAAAPTRPDIATVELFDLHRGETATFEIPRDGELSIAEQKRLGRFLRCRRTGRYRRMKRGLVAMLAAVASEYPGHPIEVISGYRNEANQGRHRQGRAVDLRVQGVKLHELRDFLWSSYTDEVGIGYYPRQDFIHMDSRPRHSAIAWSQHRDRAPYRYNPRWARKIRRTQATAAIAAATPPAAPAPQPPIALNSSAP